MLDFIRKWYTYQKERFPVIVYGLYVFTIVFATFCVANLALNLQQKNYYIMIPMFIVAFLQFLMVRIVDEFKDYDEDCKYRPYRPVPRGLITLKELKILFIICIILQLVITYLLNPKGLLYLFIVWIFFAIMSKSFFIKNFIDKHLLVEVFLDEIIMPICVLYIVSFVGELEISEIWLFLLLTYVVSWIMEIARKIRSKDKEEKGVKTYTAVYGIDKAIFILFVLETILMLLHMNVIGKFNIVYALIPYLIVVLIDLLFLNKRNKKCANMVQISASLYVFVMYLSMGLLIK